MTDRTRRWHRMTERLDKRVLPVVLLALATVTVIATVPSPEAASAASPSVVFEETFDGDPATPQPWDPAGWDVAVHSRDVDTWHELESVHAGHAHDCSAPPSTHGVTSYEDAVFNCKNHVMTSLNASGYGAIYLTPDHMVDFSDGEAVVNFDLSTLRTSTRDWVDVWITPYEDNLQAPLEGFLPDLAGPPRNAVQVRMNNAGDGTMFEVKVYRSHDDSKVAGKWWVAYESFLTPDAARRDTFELRISRDHLTFGMPDYDEWWVDADIGDLGWDQGVVQFGHHSYNPTKDGSGTPNTWHWDNVRIEPAVPFTIVKADRRYIDPDTTSTVTFDTPAPADAHLRFSGMGERFEVSFDGGGSWSVAQKPSQSTSHGLLYSNYWTPIPEGTREVQVRGQRGWLPSWIAKDFAVWSRGTSVVQPAPDPDTEPTPTAAPTTEPTPTAAPTTEPTPTPEPEPSPGPTNPEPMIGEEFTAGGWTTAARASDASVVPGESTTISATVTASRSRRALVDVEVYSPSGRKVYQRAWDNRSFTRGRPRTFSTVWTVPANAPEGPYTVKIGVFNTRWRSLYHWNDTAGTLTLDHDAH